MMNSNNNSTTVYHRLFSPQSIAVIGASNNVSKPGGRILKNISEQGYQGSLWAINPKSTSIMDLPTYNTINQLPETPELAIIAIPAPLVVKSMEQLAAKGVKMVMVLSAGFSEIGRRGKEMEQNLLKIAHHNEMTLIGPNCVGILTPVYAGKFAGIIPKLKKGSVDLISCSGATVDQLMEQATIRGLSFSNMVTTGNSAQMGVEDILALTDENFGPDSSRILLLYLESIKKPKKLQHHARSLTQKGCHIVTIKSGVTSAGRRAAASHTGAIVTNNTAVDALFEKSGIIRVQSKSELIDIASILSVTHGPLKGNRVCIITDAGGPGVMLSDELNRQGLDLPVLTEQTQKKLSDVLPPQSPITNPIDCLPTRNGEQIRAILQILEDEEKDNIDIIVIITSNSMLRDNWDTYEEIIHGMDNQKGIPIIPVLSPGTTGVELIEKFKSFGKLYFHDEVPIAKALGKIVKRPMLYNQNDNLKHFDNNRISNILTHQKGLLIPETAAELLHAAGFKLPLQQDVFEKSQIKKVIEKIGFPLVMKVSGLIHKSDAGGVKVGINNYEQAIEVWEQLMQIEGAKGVLVQQMIQGHEVILGASRLDGYGHLIMFGLGGIYTEVFKDVQFGLAPLAKEECTNMITRIKGHQIFEGARGAKGMSVEIMADYLRKLSRLVMDYPEISEIDLNPLKGFDSELYTVDARIILD